MLTSRRRGPLKPLILSAAVFALGLWLVMALVGDVGGREGEKQMELVRGAATRAALTCYAVEGRYPQSLDYLKEHYGLVYDQGRYLVFYDAFASNILPQIRVAERGKGM